MLKHLPNFLTCCNLFCGCAGIVAVAENQPRLASVLIFIGLLFDFLDGFVARLLKAYSEIGKQLDSLADMVTFGVLPSLLVFHLFHSKEFFAYFSFLIAVFSALRLARFNTDTRQTDQFIGLPTPANAVFWASLAFIFVQHPYLEAIIGRVDVLLTLTLLMSCLLVVPLPLLALKFKDFSWRNNQVRYVFLILSVILLVIWQFLAVPLIILLYIVCSIIFKNALH
jgi:CDP-diacylglycerol--serine O-phosphatidyltransferase